jgi:radical SAM protein with 4Fe4S-binding SPASM domain
MPIEADRGTHGGHALPSPARIRAIEAIRPVHSCGIRPSRPGAACLAGVNRLAITARGEILPCVAIRRPIGRIEEGLPAAWRRLQAEGVDIMMHSSGPERCSDCALAERCLPCPGESLAATGSLAEPALERCYVTMANHGDGRRKAEGGGRERGVERDTHHAPHFTHNAQRTTRNVSS